MSVLRKICLISIVIVLAGCGAHSLRPSLDLQERFQEVIVGDSLWKVDIFRFGKSRFSGILALKNDQLPVRFALLDASGIKLFEENISADGSVSIIGNLQMFDNHPLPNYLGKVVYQVFIEAATAATCSAIFSNLCWQQDQSLGEKTAKFGPLPLWKVKYNINADADRLTEAGKTKIEHNSSWLATTVYLQKM